MSIRGGRTGSRRARSRRALPWAQVGRAWWARVALRTAVAVAVLVATNGTVATLTAQPATAAGAAGATWRSCAPSDSSCVVPAVREEFRGVWVASVANIDWPSRAGLPTDSAKLELLALLDDAVRNGLNAVIFQVRPAADALYESALEPWSEYLTGAQGRAPSPRWDPLAFAVREAHARGLELHAWFNPYRARHNSARTPEARSHIARTHRGLVKKYGDFLWMDPGSPTVQQRTLDVVVDLATRYDVDGVHLDDYFYPYPVQRRGVDVPFPDDASYARYVKAQRRAGRGVLARDDWRRANVDSLMARIDRRVHAVKPWVRFGISPFGIWRPGSPASVKGFDAYAKLYADSRLWLQRGWGDYFAPQLYWPTTKPEQAYGTLLRWWQGENPLGRHLWIGNGTYRVVGRDGWGAGEVLAQVDSTRAAGAGGNIHFNARTLLEDKGGVATALRTGPYAEPARVPGSGWLPAGAPCTVRITGTEGTLRVARGDGCRLPKDGVRWWEVRTAGGEGGGWSYRRVPGDVASFDVGDANRVAVRAVSRNGVAGAWTVMRR